MSDITPTDNDRALAPGVLRNVYAKSIDQFKIADAMDKQLCYSVFDHISTVVADKNDSRGESTMTLISKRIVSDANLSKRDEIDDAINGKRSTLETTLPAYVIGIVSTESGLWYSVDQIVFPTLTITSKSGHYLSRFCKTYDQFHMGRTTTFEEARAYLVNLTSTALKIVPAYNIVQSTA